MILKPEKLSYEQDVFSNWLIPFTFIQKRNKSELSELKNKDLHWYDIKCVALNTLEPRIPEKKSKTATINIDIFERRRNIVFFSDP